jgi:transposase
MSENPSIEVANIGHLGLVSAITKKYDLLDIMESILPKSSNRQNISHADAILAMIYMGLGFGSEPLYLVKQYFKDTPLESLFKKGVVLEDFNDDVLGRALDAIFIYGPTKFFFNVAAKIISENKLFTKFSHMDSSSFSFGGKKYKDGNIKITYGHSKDHRSDLKQLVQLLVTTNNGLPFWSQSLDGNSSDKVVFPEAMAEVQGYFDKNLYGDLGVLVADSSLYSKNFLLNKKIKGYWITRVPESLKMAKHALSREYYEGWMPNLLSDKKSA